MKKFLTFFCVVVYDVKMQGAAVGVAVPIQSSSSDGRAA